MEQHAIHSSDQLIERAIAIAKEGRKKRVAVAAAQDADVIHAVAQARDEGFLDATLVGDRARIEGMAAEKKISLDGLDIVDSPDVMEAAHAAVSLASEKRADIIMKGFLPTSALLKVVLDKKYNLRGKNTLSHCAVLDIPGYHKMLNITDGGMVVKPNLEQKLQILENAVMVARALELSPVKVALSSAGEQVSEKMPHTLTDVESIMPVVRERFSDVEIQGPLSFDMATSSEAARLRGHHGQVIGDSDIYLVDSIEEGNLLSKALILFAEAVFCGVIVGAKLPVSLVSRTDTVRNKKASLALASVVADYLDQMNSREEN
jgi:phosphate butyryltransferase